MQIPAHIQAYIQSQPEGKRRDMQTLHNLVLSIMPDCTLWFLDGRDEQGKIVSNPSIGYGVQTTQYANGKTKDFYQLGISANTSGISVYIMGLKDCTYLAQTYAPTLGKATVTGYCITFKTLEQIQLEVLEAAMRDGVEQTRTR